MIQIVCLQLYDASFAFVVFDDPVVDTSKTEYCCYVNITEEIMRYFSCL